MFPPVTHKIPEPFVRKIKLDNAMSDFRLYNAENKLIVFSAYKTLRDDLDLTRYSCQKFIKNQRGTGGSAGSG